MAHSYIYLALLGLAALVLSKLFAYPVSRLLNVRANAVHPSARPAPRAFARDPLLGLDLGLPLRRAMKEHRFLQAVPRVFTDQPGGARWTLEVNLAGDGQVWTADPENVRSVLAQNPKDWRIGQTRRDAIGPTFGRNIILEDGDWWHESRQVMRPGFARKHFGKLELLDKHVSRMLERLPADGITEVDLKPLFYMLSMDVSTEFIFGVSTNNLTQEDQEGLEFAEAIDLVQGYVVKGQWLGKLGALLFPNKKMQAAVQTVKNGLQNFIRKATANLPTSGEKDSESSYNTLLEMLRAWTDQPDRVINEATILIIGGRDTTASLLSNLFYHLAKNPDIWARVREEALALPENPTFEEIRDSKFLFSCVRESLRLVNPTIDLSRTAAVDTVMPRGGGPDGKSPLVVRKNTNIILWIYVMHHREDIWGPDVEQFRPDRWEGFRATDWTYLPFGAGPRICIGQQLALTEAMYATFRLARRFAKVESRDFSPWQENLGIATSSLNGNQVVLVPA